MDRELRRLGRVDRTGFAAPRRPCDMAPCRGGKGLPLPASTPPRPVSHRPRGFLRNASSTASTARGQSSVLNSPRSSAKTLLRATQTDLVSLRGALAFANAHSTRRPISAMWYGEQELGHPAMLMMALSRIASYFSCVTRLCNMSCRRRVSETASGQYVVPTHGTMSSIPKNVPQATGNVSISAWSSGNLSWIHAVDLEVLAVGGVDVLVAVAFAELSDTFERVELDLAPGHHDPGNGLSVRRSGDALRPSAVPAPSDRNLRRTSLRSRCSRRLRRP